jgi:hypothetical protein
LSATTLHACSTPDAWTNMFVSHGKHERARYFSSLADAPSCARRDSCHVHYLRDITQCCPGLLVKPPKNLLQYSTKYTMRAELEGLLLVLFTEVDGPRSGAGAAPPLRTFGQSASIAWTVRDSAERRLLRSRSRSHLPGGPRRGGEILGWRW